MMHDNGCLGRTGKARTSRLAASAAVVGAVTVDVIRLSMAAAASIGVSIIIISRA